jgi:dTMP kinase
MSKSYFITFEGPEGGGKSTQCCRLAERLRAEGHNVLVTRQPGGDPLGAKIRALLLDPAGVPIAPLAEVLMMMADRAQAVEKLIRPHLDRGGMVICDRYTDSSVAYQGYGRGIALDSVDWLNFFATGGLAPDLTFLLDLDPEIGLARQAEQTRMEREDAAFHARVRAGYLEQARKYPERFAVIDASADMDQVAGQIWIGYEAHCRHCP